MTWKTARLHVERGEREESGQTEVAMLMKKVKKVTVLIWEGELIINRVSLISARIWITRVFTWHRLSTWLRSVRSWARTPEHVFFASSLVTIITCRLGVDFETSHGDLSLSIYVEVILPLCSLLRGIVDLVTRLRCTCQPATHHKPSDVSALDLRIMTLLLAALGAIQSHRILISISV